MGRRKTDWQGCKWQRAFWSLFFYGGRHQDIESASGIHHARGEIPIDVLLLPSRGTDCVAQERDNFFKEITTLSKLNFPQVRSSPRIIKQCRTYACTPTHLSFLQIVRMFGYCLKNDYVCLVHHRPFSNRHSLLLIPLPAPGYRVHPGRRPQSRSVRQPEIATFSSTDSASKYVSPPL